MTKHKWEIQCQPYTPGWSGVQRCSVCGEEFNAPLDLMNGDKTQKFVDRQHARKDCIGKSNE